MLTKQSMCIIFCGDNKFSFESRSEGFFLSMHTMLPCPQWRFSTMWIQSAKPSSYNKPRPSAAQDTPVWLMLQSVRPQSTATSLCWDFGFNICLSAVLLLCTWVHSMMGANISHMYAILVWFFGLKLWELQRCPQILSRDATGSAGIVVARSISVHFSFRLSRCNKVACPYLLLCINMQKED